MISPDILSRYGFFGFLNQVQLEAIGRIAEELSLPKGRDIFRVGTVADALYFLTEGKAELHFVLEDPNDPLIERDVYITDISPGEIFGISSMLDQPLYAGTVRAIRACRAVKIPASQLHALTQADGELECALMRALAHAAMERLRFTRVQLAEAYAETPSHPRIPKH